jgi:hypothetical protein
VKDARQERSEELRRRRERKNRRLAWVVAAAAALLGLAGIRLEGTPEGRGTSRAPKVRWGGDGGEGGAGMRTVLDPTAYALAGEAGFTGAWWKERPDAVSLEDEGAAAGKKSDAGEEWKWDREEKRGSWRPFTGGKPAAAAGRSLAAGIGAAAAELDRAEMRFPEGWEPRMFSGVELDYPNWTARGWRAKAEVEFDVDGRAEHVFLTQPSGVEEVDTRLARGIRRWRLLDEATARRGEVEWVVPAKQARGGIETQGVEAVR